MLFQQQFTAQGADPGPVLLLAGVPVLGGFNHHCHLHQEEQDEEQQAAEVRVRTEDGGTAAAGDHQGQAG